MRQGSEANEFCAVGLPTPTPVHFRLLRGCRWKEPLLLLAGWVCECGLLLGSLSTHRFMLRERGLCVSDQQKQACQQQMNE